MSAAARVAVLLQAVVVAAQHASGELALRCVYTAGLVVTSLSGVFAAAAVVVVRWCRCSVEREQALPARLLGR